MRNIMDLNTLNIGNMIGNMIVNDINMYSYINEYHNVIVYIERCFIINADNKNVLLFHTIM